MPLASRIFKDGWSALLAAALLLLFSCSAVAANPVREVIAGPSQSAETQLRWQTYRRFASREGLPRNWVTALAQDGDGFILAGTEGGLARYDGQHWTRALFPLDAAARQPYVNALSTATSGSVWVGTDTAGLFVYRDGKLEHKPLSSVAATLDIESLYADADHGMWVGTDDGIYLCRDDHCSEIEAFHGLRVKCILPARDASGEYVYIGTPDSGVYRIDDPYHAPQRSNWHLTHADGLPGDSVGSLIEWGGAAGKDLWIGTVQGVARLAGERLMVYADAVDFPDGVTGFLRVPQRDGAEKLIATMPVGGLVEFSNDGQWRRTTTANGLPENAVNAAMLTGVGQSVPVLWLASGHSGVLRAEPQMWSAFEEHDGLPNRIVYAIGETHFLDDKDAIWIGTADGSARWVDGQWRPWLPARYAHSEVFGMVREADRLWVATRQGVLLESRSGVREYTTANSELPDNAVAGMHLQTAGDAAGTLWLGTHNGIAKIRNDRLEREDVPGMPSNFFVRVMRSTDNQGETIVWAGAEQGLFYRRGNAWQKMNCAGLVDTAVFDLRERGTPGRDHVLWAATFNGAVRIDLDKDSSCTQLELPASEQASSIYQVQFDERNRMYLFGADGVTRLTVDSHARAQPGVEHFGLADGLPDLEFSRASLVDSQGRLWGGTIEGAAMYDPSAEVRTNTPRPLRILAVTDEQNGHLLQPGADLREAESNVVFDLSLLAYQREYRTRYRSQLLGLEDRPGDWMESAHRSYSRLPAGAYTFQAWARDADGVESGAVAWHFRVHAPWWRGTWAFGLYALALVLLGLFFGRWRARALAGRARELEQEVAERTYALAEANRQLAHAALTDPLTGLWNRRFFSLEFPPECERAIRRVTRNEHAADLIFLLADVDHFKHINDQYGHSAGDAVLVELARRIRGLLRSGDVAVRWGGEEFLVVLRDAERHNAQALASRLREAVAATPFAVQNDHMHVTCSLGWAAYPFEPEAPRRHSVDQLITFADAALYRAKHTGRNRVVGATLNPDASAADAVEFTLVEAAGHARLVESPPG
ncbi:MAG: diguanylate cyclase [Dokdonella sp.]